MEIKVGRISIMKLNVKILENKKIIPIRLAMETNPPYTIILEKAEFTFKEG